jgi:hypothetical protein
MKKLLTILAILVGFSLSSVSAMAQSGGGSSSSSPIAELAGGDISSACWSTKKGVGNNPWSMGLVVEILRKAKDTPELSSMNLSLGQTIQRYHACDLSITYMGENRFRVTLGGGGGSGVTVLIDIS